MDFRENKLEIRRIADFLLQGRIGEANSRWNNLLGNLAGFMRGLDETSQQKALVVLKNILNQQQTQDWVAMSDALNYELLPFLESS
ncbi:MAG: hypothetical protein GX801_06020 [Fibrobacter sp.]|nr:hypothetical protein [Fibrobacter sp.]